MSNIEEATERVAEFARQYRMRLDVPADGKIYTVWIDPNAEEATLNLNDLEALTAAAPHIQAAALRDAALDFPTELREFAWTDPATGLIDYISVQDWLDARADQLERKTK